MPDAEAPTAVPMRALSIKQPWADAIAFGSKRVENRTWKAPARSAGHVIAIHASKAVDRSAQFPPGEIWRSLPECARFMDRTGVIIAVTLVAGCHHSDECGGQNMPDGRRRQWRGCSPWSVCGQYHWELTDVRPLSQPVPCSARLGLVAGPARRRSRCLRPARRHARLSAC